MSGKTAKILVSNWLTGAPEHVEVRVLARSGVLIMHPAYRLDGRYTVSHEPIGHAFGHFPSQRVALDFLRHAARTVPKALLKPTATREQWEQTWRANNRALKQLKARRDALQMEPARRRKATR